MPSGIGRLVVDVQTNKSGGAVAYGDVVVSDTSNDRAFTTTTTAGFTAGVVGVCIEPNGIANNATGRIQYQGYCAQVNCNASVTRGYTIKTHTVAKQGTGINGRAVGAFGVALTTATNPAAYLWGLPDANAASGNVAGDPIWDAKGDLAVGTGADTAAKLTVGANDFALIAASGESTGLKYGPTFTDWTPVITCDTTNPTMGSGASATGRYARIGDLVVAQGNIVFGSSGVAAGSGVYEINLPATADAASTLFVYGSGLLFDSSANQFTTFECYFLDTGEFRMIFSAAGGNYIVTNALPWTWAANDIIRFQLWYEAA